MQLKKNILFCFFGSCTLILNKRKSHFLPSISQRNKAQEVYIHFKFFMWGHKFFYVGTQLVQGLQIMQLRATQVPQLHKLRNLRIKLRNAQHWKILPYHPKTNTSEMKWQHCECPIGFERKKKVICTAFQSNTLQKSILGDTTCPLGWAKKHFFF